MDFAEQLRILKAAAGDPALLYLASVDLAHPSLTDAERARIKEAIIAAAVPHWCDATFLAALLATTAEESERLIGWLRTLKVVEPFTARGDAAFNVHETARLTLREHLRTTDAALWCSLATRARTHLAGSTEPHARIEALFHHFAIDQAAAAEACEALDREFTLLGHPEINNAFALPLVELTTAGWLTGAAQVEALLAPLEVRNVRGEAAQLEVEARQILALALATTRLSVTARAHCFLGDVLKTKGNLADALAAFREGFSILQKLAEQDATNVGWQRDLAGAHIRVGGIYQAQGKLDDALTAYREDLRISQKLAEQDATNAGWQRELAGAHSRVGSIYETQGNMDDALTAYLEGFRIMQKLAEQDATNADWQRDLAVSHSRVGDIYKAQGRRDDALAAFREYLRISQKLSEQDATNVGWQRELAAAHNRVGGIYKAQDKLDDALAAFREYLRISQKLAEQDATNADWQRELAASHHCLGVVLQQKGEVGKAQSSFRWAVKTMERAAAMSPGNVGWQRDLANFKNWLRKS